MRSFRTPVMILCFIISPLILLFNIIFGPYGIRLRDFVDPYWIYFTDESGSSIFSPFQQILFRVIYISILLSLITSMIIFLHTAISLKSQKRIKIYTVSLATGLLYLEPFFRIIANFIFPSGIFPHDLSSYFSFGIWQFIEDYVGPGQFYGYLKPVTYISGLLTHLIAASILVLSILDRKYNSMSSMNFGSKNNHNFKTDFRARYSEYKYCPYCAETILAQAILCKHCKSKLN